ncbi:DUF2326 domain-containing protein [Methanospirillum lacunae]|uniref:DUF2326 domain-containing protein n=1 Tax=Methanospirillum lacunae TaxID=668570 RepID=A0A2V2NAG9_9EURY|nr:DUF2326 domain-containing protein [Methanospirillum lacunae]PWR72551.1 hypothetical protein DK846_06170 [Methanospirillum lacunae]
MLVEIRCQLFKNELITFHEGLNVILGDEKATNSIGKTTFLMIIDFVFGGESFLKKNGGAIKHLGHHIVYFTFKFSHVYYYFSRESDKHNIVKIYDKNKNLIEEISIQNFREFLKEKYELEHLIYLSFREVIGPYSRIWGKKYDLNKPINIDKEPDKKAITRLLKLFNMYDNINSHDKKIDYLTKKKQTFKDATKYDIIPDGITKKIYEDAIKRNEKIETEILDITNNLEKNRTNLDVLLSDELLSLKNKISQLHIKRNILKSELNSIVINLTTQDKKIRGKLSNLAEFFPDINLDKLKLIDTFHNNISNILKDQLKEREKILNERIKNLDNEILQQNAEFDNLITYNENNVSRLAIEKLIDLSQQKIKNFEIINIYIDKNSIQDDLSQNIILLSDIKLKIQSDIMLQLNTKMGNINNQIYDNHQFPPSLDLKDNKYSFNNESDTGTGKAYTGIIILDLAIFSLTPLSIIIHDSMLFKNIQTSSFEKIIELYYNQTKQIFISTDSINNYNEKTQKILNIKKVLQLSYENTLYPLKWNEEKK